VGTDHVLSNRLLLVLLILILLVLLDSHGDVLDMGYLLTELLTAERHNVSSAPQGSRRGSMIRHDRPALRARSLLIQSLILNKLRVLG